MSTKLYRTVLGDTWDGIAKRFYGDELKADILMQNNLDLIDIVIFGSDSIMLIPDINYQDDVDVPEWRAST